MSALEADTFAGTEGTGEAESSFQQAMQIQFAFFLFEYKLEHNY